MGDVSYVLLGHVRSITVRRYARRTHERLGRILVFVAVNALVLSGLVWLEKIMAALQLPEEVVHE